MSKENDERTLYHSRLLQVSRSFDPIIEKLKQGHIDEKYHWLGWLLVAPFRDLLQLKKTTQTIMQILNTNLIVWISSLFLVGLGGGIMLPVINDQQSVEMIITLPIALFIAYMIGLYGYFKNLTNFRSDHFHTGAYRTFRSQEYDTFKLAFLDGPADFYFEGLYDYVGKVMRENGDIDQVISLVNQKLDNFLQYEKMRYVSEIESLEDINHLHKQYYDEMTEEYETFVSQLIDEKKNLLEGSRYTILLLKDINKILYRMKNDKFTTNDLQVISPFTLYKLNSEKHQLVQIGEAGTSGASKKIINLDNNSHYGVVEVLKNEYDWLTPAINEPYENRIILSFKMKMSDDQVWVYNFHFDKEEDSPAFNLLVKSGIIDAREVLRLVHALCLLLEDSINEGLQEGVERNASSTNETYSDKIQGSNEDH